MVYVGSEVVKFVERQYFGRVFLELGVRGGGKEVVADIGGG